LSRSLAQGQENRKTRVITSSKLKSKRDRLFFDAAPASLMLLYSRFVVNIISEAFLEAANYTSIDAPPEVSEWELSGLTKESSKMVKPPRVKESAFSMECVLVHDYDMKVSRQRWGRE